MVFHFLKSFLIGLGFCIVVNTMNIWIDIYIVIPHFAQKIKNKKNKFVTHNTKLDFNCKILLDFL